MAVCCGSTPASDSVTACCSCRNGFNYNEDVISHDDMNFSDVNLVSGELDIEKPYASAVKPRDHAITSRT